MPCHSLGSNVSGGNEGPAMFRQMRNIAILFKMRIGVAIALSALAGVAVAPGPAPGAINVALLCS